LKTMTQEISANMNNENPSITKTTDEQTQSEISKVNTIIFSKTVIYNDDKQSPLLQMRGIPLVYEHTLQPAIQLRKILKSLSQKKYIYTDKDVNLVKIALENMNIVDLFEAIIHLRIEKTEDVIKLCQKCDCVGRESEVLIFDQDVNILKLSKELGMHTVLYDPQNTHDEETSPTFIKIRNIESILETLPELKTYKDPEEKMVLKPSKDAIFNFQNLSKSNLEKSSIVHMSMDVLPPRKGVESSLSMNNDETLDEIPSKKIWPKKESSHRNRKRLTTISPTPKTMKELEELNKSYNVVFQQPHHPKRVKLDHIEPRIDPLNIDDEDFLEVRRSTSKVRKLNKLPPLPPKEVEILRGMKEKFGLENLVERHTQKMKPLNLVR